MVSALRKVFNLDTFTKFENLINQISAKVNSNLQTRNNQYYFFIKQGMIGSDSVIDLTCMCRTINHWQPPHDLLNIYCKSCGSKFNLLEIEGDPGYIITSNGPIRVIGSNVPDFNDLSPDKKFELLKQCEQIMKDKYK